MTSTTRVKRTKGLKRQVNKNKIMHKMGRYSHKNQELLLGFWITIIYLWILGGNSHLPHHASESNSHQISMYYSPKESSQQAKCWCPQLWLGAQWLWGMFGIPCPFWEILFLHWLNQNLCFTISQYNSPQQHQSQGKKDGSSLSKLKTQLSKFSLQEQLTKC